MKSGLPWCFSFSGFFAGLLAGLRRFIGWFINVRLIDLILKSFHLHFQEAFPDIYNTYRTGRVKL